LFLLFLATGAGCPFVAFNEHSRHEPGKMSWLSHFVKHSEDEEHVEAMTMLVPLPAGVDDHIGSDGRLFDPAARITQRGSR
jgi:hypothetical protein